MTFLDRYGPWGLVTGAAAGIGRQYALQLAERGLDVVALDIDQAGLAALQSEIEKQGRQIRAIPVDLRNRAALDDAFASVADLDIGLVINNAAVMALGPFTERSVDEHLTVVDVNIRATLLTAHHFLPRLGKRGRGGFIIMSSMSAFFGTTTLAHYAATKAWNHILAEGLWQEWRKAGVDVISVLPGATRTPGFLSSKPQIDRAKTVAEPSDVAREGLDALGSGPCWIASKSSRVAFPLISKLIPRRKMIEMGSRSIERLYGSE